MVSLAPTQESSGCPRDASSGYTKASLTWQVDSIQPPSQTHLLFKKEGPLW